MRFAITAVESNIYDCGRRIELIHLRAAIYKLQILRNGDRPHHAHEFGNPVLRMEISVGEECRAR